MINKPTVGRLHINAMITTAMRSGALEKNLRIGSDRSRAGLIVALLIGSPPRRLEIADVVDDDRDHC